MSLKKEFKELEMECLLREDFQGYAEMLSGFATHPSSAPATVSVEDKTTTIPMEVDNEVNAPEEFHEIEKY